MLCIFTEDKKEDKLSTRRFFATRKRKNVKADIIHKVLFAPKTLDYFFFYTIFRCHQRYMKVQE